MHSTALLPGLAAVALVLCLLFPASSSAQSGRGLVTADGKAIQAVRVDTAPVIDGVMDEAVWQQAIPISDFHQINPGDHVPPSEQTWVYVVYTEDALYVGARMNDSDPHLIAAPTIRHGEGMGGDDRLVLILDPFNTRRTGYRFETNLNAMRHDALYQSVSSFSADWSTIWNTATSTYENGWIAEIEIPFKSLPFDPATEEWGFNFGRGIRRRGEEVAWVSYNRTYNPSISGVLTGMRGMEQGLGLDVVPSMSVSRHRDYASGVTDYEEQPSLDVFYRLTPSLNAALTINTDFSATDVDNRQVNLTRFSLFFPEKRDFFLNDSDLFQFGGIGSNRNEATSDASVQNARPYFSRRLGLSSTGEPVDIEYGGRLSGRVGRWNVGTLAIHQAEFGATDASDLFIARVSANVLAESNLGMILTHGDPGSNQDNTVVGMDFRYLNTRLASGRQLEGDAWYLQSDTPGLNGDDAAFGFGVRSPNNAGWRAGAGFKEVQENFNPAMGYVNRSNVRDYTADVGYTRFFTEGPFQRLRFGIDMQRINEIDQGLQSEVVEVRVLNLQTRQNDGFNIRYRRNREVVRDPFTVYREPDRSVVIQPGDYTFNDYTIFVGTGNQRQFAIRGGYTWGEFHDGDKRQLGLNLDWNQSRHFRMGLNFNWNDISLPQGDFTVRLLGVNTQVAFSSTLFWISLVQYDNISEELGINTRLQWVPRAGQEGFIVLNYGMEDRDKDNSFHTSTSDLSIKFKYTLRF